LCIIAIKWHYIFYEFQEDEKVGRVYNFSAGPAVLPVEVLQEAADEMLDYRGTGMSVMEMSHRSKAYDNIIKEAEADLRELMNIPDNYKVLFLQGGASQQFAMIPMNLMKNKKAAYIVTGQWAKKAYQEAQMYGEAVKVASSEDKTFSYIPDCSDLDIPEDADYESMALSLRHCLTQRDIHLLQMFLHVSFQSL
jgi:phosphoserine aminotransferase